MNSHIYIGPPGIGKTFFKDNHPGRFIDPEESIDWKKMDLLYNHYLRGEKRGNKRLFLEHELNWPAVWIEEVLPRLWAGLSMEKDIIMGMVTPANAELVSRFFSGLKKHVTLILPDKEKHFLRVWNDEKKRPKTWGSELRGWQNTNWIRLLLQGMAAELGLNVIGEPILLPESKVRDNKSGAREARDERGKKYIEVFFGRWAELNDQDEIIAMHRELTSNNNILLQCDKTSKVCGKGLHDCGAIRVLDKDVYGNSLTDWIASDKLRKPIAKKKNAVIFFAGTLAPFHRGHLKALDAAKDHLESRGWNVIGGYASAFASIQKDRVGSLYPILGSVETRNTLLQLGVKQSDWIMPDFPVEHVLRQQLIDKGKHPMQNIARRLRNSGIIRDDDSLTTFWINGKDAILKPEFFKDFAKYANKNPVNPLRMLIVDNRPGNDYWTKDNLMSAVPEVIPFVSRCQYLEAKPTSATEIRQALITADRIKLKELVGNPLVEAYLMGKMQK